MAGPGFNVESFKSYVAASGLVQTNKFLARFSVPPAMFQTQNENNSGYVTTARQLEYWCEVTNLPGMGFNYHEVRRYGYGPFEKRPHAPIFQEVLFSFYADAQGAIWTFFQQWMKLIYNYDMRAGIDSFSSQEMQPYELNYKSDYAVDIEVIVFDNTGKEVMAVVLREAYPINIADIALNWQDTSSIMRIPVNITFFDWFNRDVSDLVDRRTLPPT